MRTGALLTLELYECWNHDLRNRETARKGNGRDQGYIALGGCTGDGFVSSKMFKEELLEMETHTKMGRQ